MNGVDMAGDGAATWVYSREYVPVPVGVPASGVAHPHSFAKAVRICSDIFFSLYNQRLTVSACLCFE